MTSFLPNDPSTMYTSDVLPPAETKLVPITARQRDYLAAAAMMVDAEETIAVIAREVLWEIVGAFDRMRD